MDLAVKNNQLQILTKLPNTTSKDLQLYNAYNVAKKIGDFSTKEDLLLMNSLILRWANYVGIQKPDPSEVNAVSNFIKENYPKFNSYDISECINLLVNQKLNTNAEHYGNLNMIYISKVLKAYQVYRGEILFKVREQIKKLEEAKIVPPTEKERIENFKQNLINAKEEVEKGLVYFDTAQIIYDFIIYNKLIVLDEELKKSAMEYGQSIFIKKSNEQALKDVVNNVAFRRVKLVDIQVRYAREYIANFWLKETDIVAFNEKITIEMLQY